MTELDWLVILLPMELMSYIYIKIHYIQVDKLLRNRLSTIIVRNRWVSLILLFYYDWLISHNGWILNYLSAVLVRYCVVYLNKRLTSLRLLTKLKKNLCVHLIFWSYAIINKRLRYVFILHNIPNLYVKTIR